MFLFEIRVEFDSDPKNLSSFLDMAARLQGHVLWNSKDRPKENISFNTDPLLNINNDVIPYDVRKDSDEYIDFKLQLH